MVEVDLTEFREATERKVTWGERVQLIQRKFPVVDALAGAPSPEGELAWRKVFDRDPHLLGTILRDLLKSEQAVPGRPGPRPAIDAARAQPTVDRWLGKDPLDHPYTSLPFHAALALLFGGRSLNHVAAKTGVGRYMLRRLLINEAVPSGPTMEAIAAGFGKQPSWFLEYRVGAVAAAIVHKLTSSPDHSVRAYEAMFAARKAAERLNTDS